MDYYYHTTACGIRTVFRPSTSAVAHLGVLIGAGSRDEGVREHGLAHFIEHTLFKGTTHRKSWHILNYIDSVGGEINAFTAREETCLYASIPLRFTERAMVLLSDVFAHSTFPEKELEKEKEVVIEEIHYYRDLPDETILDEFEEHVFAGHPLGRAVLGTASCIKSFTGDTIRRFIQKHYTQSSVVVSCTANMPPQQWVRLAEKYFGNIPLASAAPMRRAFQAYQPFNLQVPKKNHQGHCTLGAEAYPFHHPNRVGLIFLNNLLGGPGNNSRLNISLREKRGLVYNIESNYTPYTDTGIFSIYMGADHERMTPAIELVKKELQLLCRQQLSTLQLHRAKQQIMGQLTVSQESNMGEMLSMGKSMLVRGTAYPLEQIIREIGELSSPQLLAIANEVFPAERISLLCYTAA